MDDWMWGTTLAAASPLTYVVILESLVICAGLAACFFMWRRLRSRRAHFRWVMQASGLYMFEYDVQRDEIWFSPQCAKLLEVPELVQSFSRVSEETKNTTLRRGLACVRKVMACSKEKARFEILKPDGRMGIFDARSEEFVDENGRQMSRVGILADVTREVREQEALDAEGGRDSATGVFHAGTTRFLIERRMREQRPLLSGAFILVEVAGMDAVRAASGGAQADAILKALAQKLLETVRGNDILGRMDGDRFAIYIGNQLGYKTLYNCCSRFGKAAAASLTDAAKAAGASVHIGGAMIHEADELREISARAEKALSAARVQPGDTCCVID